MTLETILTILGSNVVVAIFGFLSGKRKSSAETDNIVLKNLETSILLYKGIIDDLREEILTLNIKVQSLEQKIDELHEENKRLKANL